MNSNKRKLMISFITVATIFAVWLLVSHTGIVSKLFLPSPIDVLRAFFKICKEGYKTYTFWQHLFSSLWRICLAFIIAVVIGVPLGLISGYIPFVKAVTEPIVEFYRPLPPLAYYTLLILWMGIENESKIMLLFLACFAPIYVACVSAVSKIQLNYIRNAKALGASRMQIFFRVIMPFSLPDILSGMRIALGVGYTTLVAAEMVAARSGIGWMVLDASNYLRSDVVFVGIITLAIIGILSDNIIRLIKKYCVPWEGKDI